MTVTPNPFDPTTEGISPGLYQRRWRILTILCLSPVTIVIAVSSLNVALPTIITSLNASSTESLWIIESYALVFAVILLPAGAVGDRFGRKGALLGGLGVFGVMALVASFATNPTQLIVARAVQGIGAAFIMPATLSIITTVFPRHERQKAIATWAGFAGAGGALGPLLSGLALRLSDAWHVVFWINIPLVVVLGALATKWVPNSRDPHGHELDPVGSLLSIAALGTLVFGIIEGPEQGWGSGLVVGCFVAAAITATAFIGFELKANHPMLDPRLFRLRGLSGGSMAITTAFFAMFGNFFLASQYLQFVHHYSPLEAGVRMLPSAVMMLLISTRSPLITARLGVRMVTRIGFGCIALGLLGMSTLRAETNYWFFAGFLAIIAIGMAMLMPPASALIVSSVPPSKAGVGSAVNDVTREVGGALGIAVIGTVLAAGYHQSMAGQLQSASIPPEARAAIEDSIGKATVVAETVSQKLGTDLAAQITHAASEAFIHGAHLAYLVAAVAAALGAFVVGQRIPDAVGESSK